LAVCALLANNGNFPFYLGGSMWKLRFLVLAAAAASALLSQINPPKTQLKVGDEAPDFTLPSTTGQPVKLSDFRGKKNIVLAFFPAAFTGG
jgi:cytochrome oxidase Cu insertion factor (SCO1/SenC/PrrC family)